MATTASHGAATVVGPPKGNYPKQQKRRIKAPGQDALAYEAKTRMKPPVKPSDGNAKDAARRTPRTYAPGTRVNTTKNERAGKKFRTFFKNGQSYHEYEIKGERVVVKGNNNPRRKLT